jgi:type IV pilus assembly protein PilB
MVGEIRDAETAEIACRAAVTGHLVLSTLHTQDTLGTLVRLFDMGIAPYLATAALNAVLAQRLAHRVCPACAAPYEPPDEMKRALEARFGSLGGARFRKGRGCNRCHRTGVQGRVGVFEFLVVSDELRQLMADGSTPRTLREHLAQVGFSSLEDDAFQKASQGLIPPEEIFELGLGLATSGEFDYVGREAPEAELPAMEQRSVEITVKDEAMA